MSISTPFPYSYVARALVEELGVEVERYREYVDESVYRGMSRAMFFDRETFGEDRLVPGYGELPWPDLFAKACLSERARRDLVRLYTEPRDYLPELRPPPGGSGSRR
jgi:spermidine dehydrogenase